MVDSGRLLLGSVEQGVCATLSAVQDQGLMSSSFDQGDANKFCCSDRCAFEGDIKGHLDDTDARHRSSGLFAK
jgi:hypothetical protein